MMVQSPDDVFFFTPPRGLAYSLLAKRRGHLGLKGFFLSTGKKTGHQKISRKKIETILRIRFLRVTKYSCITHPERGMLFNRIVFIDTPFGGGKGCTYVRTKRYGAHLM